MLYIYIFNYNHFPCFGASNPRFFKKHVFGFPAGVAQDAKAVASELKVDSAE